MSSSRKTYKELTLDDKLDLIRKWEGTNPRPTHQQLALEFQIGKSTVGDILKKKANYAKLFEDTNDAKRRRIDFGSKFERVNKLMWAWFKAAREKNIPLTGGRIQSKAIQFADRLGIADFKASNGWLQKFENRHHIKSYKTCREPTTVADFLAELHAVIGDFGPENVFKLDETGFAWRQLPADRDNKEDGSRVTVVFCCSAVGEKIRLWMIGRSARPRRVNPEDFGIQWKRNKKAWMTTAIFEEYLSALDSQMSGQRRQILLLMDDAIPHVSAVRNVDLTSVKILFYPASGFHPLDRGIVNVFTSHYRRSMLLHLLEKADRGRVGLTEELKKLNVLNACVWASQAWDAIPVSVIRNRFHDSGVPLGGVAAAETAEDAAIEERLVSMIEGIAGQSNLVSFVADDEDSDEWEEKLVNEYVDGSEEEEEEEEEEEVEQTEDDKMSHRDALKMVAELSAFCMRSQPNLLVKVEALRTELQRCLFRDKAATRQPPSITELVPSTSND